MQLANLQQSWTLLLPLIAWIASYLIQQEHWSKKINGIIALLIVFFATIASLFLQGDNLTSASIVAAFTTALQSEALAPLMPYLRSFPSAPTPAQSQAQPVRLTTQPMPAVSPPQSTSQPPK